MGTPRRSSHELWRVLSLLIALVVASPSHPASAPEPDVETRIQRIQGAIVPPVLIKGQPPHPLRPLNDLMATARVPGVSVAVVRDGRIEWARGFGVSHAGGPAITVETAFQA